MATNEEIDRFVADNRELIERMMNLQKENFERSAELAKEFAEEAFDTTVKAAELARKQSEDLFKATYATIASPVVQKHFMEASLEFLAGLTAMVEASPIPDCMKDAASDAERNFRQAACKANADCPAKAKKAKALKECAE